MGDCSEDEACFWTYGYGFKQEIAYKSISFRKWYNVFFFVSLDLELEYTTVHIGGNCFLIHPAYSNVCVVYCCGSTIYCYRSQLKLESSVSNIKSLLMHKSLLQMLFINCLTCYLQELSSSNPGITTSCNHKIPGWRALCPRAWFPPLLFLLNCCACFLRWGSNTLPRLVRNYFTMKNKQNFFF